MKVINFVLNFAKHAWKHFDDQPLSGGFVEELDESRDGACAKYTLSTLRTMHMLFEFSYINTYCTLRTRTCNLHIFTDDPNVHENLII
jgi:hypothetical protein